MSPMLTLAIVIAIAVVFVAIQVRLYGHRIVIGSALVVAAIVAAGYWFGLC